MAATGRSNAPSEPPRHVPVESILDRPPLGMSPSANYAYSDTHNEPITKSGVGV